MLILKPHMSVIAISTETTFVTVVKSEAVVSNNVSAATRGMLARWYAIVTTTLTDFNM